jgi:hypothetical protein
MERRIAMDVSMGLMAMLGVVAIGAGYIALPVFVHAYRRFMGPRVVTCPETLRPVEIGLDARHAAFTSVFGRPRFRVRKCARWPEHRDCDQDCVARLHEYTGREACAAAHTDAGHRA